MHVAIKLLTEPCFTQRASIRLKLQVHFLDVLGYVAALTEPLAASLERAAERAISSVQAHMVEKLRPIRQHLVAVTSILALE